MLFFHHEKEPPAAGLYWKHGGSETVEFAQEFGFGTDYFEFILLFLDHSKQFVPQKIYKLILRLHRCFFSILLPYRLVDEPQGAVMGLTFLGIGHSEHDGAVLLLGQLQRLRLQLCNLLRLRVIIGAYFMYSAVPFAHIKCFQLFELIFIILFGSCETGKKRLPLIALFTVSPEVVVMGEHATYILNIFDYFVIRTLEKDLV